MELNPVLRKELYQRFRQSKSAWILALYLLVLGGMVLGFIYLSWGDNQGYYQPGRSFEIFVLLSALQLALLAFVIPGLTAGTISGERERQTLNVLLTTPLAYRSIIWSKLIASTAFMLVLMVATLPLYGVVFLFGGVAPGQIFSVFGFFLLTLFLFAAIGLACSAYFKRTGVSTVTSYGLVLALTGGSGFLSAFLTEIGRINHPENLLQPGFLAWVVEVLQKTNPIFILAQIFGEDGFKTGVSLGLPYWGIYTLFCGGVGVALLLWGAHLLYPRRNRKTRLPV